MPVSESESSVTLNIVSTPAARPVEITVITQDIIGGVRPATADVGKIYLLHKSGHTIKQVLYNIQPAGYAPRPKSPQLLLFSMAPIK